MKQKLVGAVLALILAGCSPVRLTGEWGSPARPLKNFSKLTVVALAEGAGSRRIFEDQVVRTLEQCGVQAVPSYELYPEDAPPVATLVRELSKRGIEGIITARVTDVVSGIRYFPRDPYPGPYWRYDSYYPWGWGPYYGAGYYEPFTTVELETNLFDAATGQLVWLAQYEVMGPTPTRELAESFAPILLQSMVERELLPAANEGRAAGESGEGCGTARG